MDTSDGGVAEDTSGTETINPQSLYETLGLSSEDVDALAQIPESEISVETLPYLIMQLKAKRASETSTPTDTDYRDRSKVSEDKLDTPERCGSDRRRSPLSCDSARRSGSHEHHGKGEAHRKTDRYAGGRRDVRYRSSWERQSGDHTTAETEFTDNPTVFPHECSLCKCVVNSIKTWKEHLLGVRHKSHGSHQRNFRPYYGPHKRPYSSEPGTGDQFMSTLPDHLYPPKPNTRVVVAKFPMGAATVEDLLVLGRPYGTIVKHLVLPAKGFLEFSAHKEALNMVNHYQQKPAFIKETRIYIYLSPRVEGIHSPPKFEEPVQKRLKRTNAPTVVCFSHLPPGEGVEAEVLELAGMFGDVWQSKFTDCKAFIEMVNWRDADIMVKYYHSNPLRIQGERIKVGMSHIKSLREYSPEPPSRKSDLAKNSRPRDESTSSNKDKVDSASQEATEKEDDLMEGEEKVLDDEEGIQLEDEPGLLDEGTDDAGNTEEEEKKSEEGKMEEEEPCAAEEENMERHSEHSQEQKNEAEFPENLDDFVTLDELDNTAGGDSALDFSVPHDGKVVVIWPVPKALKDELMEDLFNLSAPFGTIVKHTLSMFRQQAMLELETPEKANEMVQFYSNHKATICGRPVSISMCLTMKAIESPSGRTVYIGSLPIIRAIRQKYTQASLFKMAKRFGKVTSYHLNRNQGTCYMQMDSVQAAEKMVMHYRRRPVKYWGSLLKIAICRKGDSLIHWRDPITDKEIVLNKTPEQNTEERELKKEAKTTEPITEWTEDEQKQQSTLANYEGVGGDPASEIKSLEEENQEEKTPLEPYNADQTVGVNYVVPVSGFFCKLCNMFYTDENRAKSEHCRSLEHYNNLKRALGDVVEQADGDPDG